MTQKSLLAPLAWLALPCALIFAGCSKNLQPLDRPLTASNNSFGNGFGRAVAWDVTLPATAHSGAMEVTEWVSETGPAEHNITTTTVDPGYVMVGGGAQVVDPNGNPNAVDAVLTAAFPIGDGTFSTYMAADKDQGGITYYSYCYSYVIGIKLYNQSGAALPTSSIIPHLVIDSVVSAVADHPAVSLYVPSGYELLSGGAFDNYGSGYGNCLTRNDYNATEQYANAGGKDQKEADPAAITCYVLAYDGQPISGYTGTNGTNGTIQVNYAAGYIAVSSDLQGLTVFTTGNSAVAGLGGYSTYTGYGRLLYGVYAYSATASEFQSKDQDVTDISGALQGSVTTITPAP